MAKTNSLKKESISETFPDPTRTKESTDDDGTHAKVGVPLNEVTNCEIVSQPGAKKAVFRTLKETEVKK